MLITIYKLIVGVARDKVMAVHYYRLAADQGYAPAQVQMIMIMIIMILTIMI